MHDVADRVAEEQRRAAHGEVGVEVRDAHGLRVALEEGDVVGLEDGGHELDEHALVATRVDRGLHGRARARCVLCVEMQRGARVMRVCAGRSAADDGRGGEGVGGGMQSVCGARGHERHEDARNTSEREGERERERDECAAHLSAHVCAKYCVVWR